ncbi:MAG: hypothetical protein M3Q27_07725 [Actinomycetota bacterium]|nr:hypothetical protein [Actinomycetota bacterium]
MTTNLTPDAAADAAQRLLNDRVDAVRALAKARQQRNDARAHLDEAERADAAAYAAAQRAGWSAEELRKVGFEEPDRKAPGRPRRARRQRATDRAAQPRTSDAEAE